MHWSGNNFTEPIKLLSSLLDPINLFAFKRIPYLFHLHWSRCPKQFFFPVDRTPFLFACVDPIELFAFKQIPYCVSISSALKLMPRLLAPSRSNFFLIHLHRPNWFIRIQANTVFISSALKRMPKTISLSRSNLFLIHLHRRNRFIRIQANTVFISSRILKQNSNSPIALNAGSNKGKHTPFTDRWAQNRNGGISSCRRHHTQCMKK